MSSGSQEVMTKLLQKTNKIQKSIEILKNYSSKLLNILIKNLRFECLIFRIR